MRLFADTRERTPAPSWWAGSPPPPTPGAGQVGEADRLLLACLVGAAAAVALVVVTGHISALVVHGGFPRYQLADLAGILGRVVGRPGDPGRAWDPVNTGAAPPGPVVWWATLAALALVPVAAAVVAGRRRSRRPTGTAWAGGGDLRRLRARPGTGRLILGRAGRRLVAVESRHSLLVLGPTQSGKTTALAVPAILEWPGPVIATSTKGDLLVP